MQNAPYIQMLSPFGPEPREEENSSKTSQNPESESSLGHDEAGQLALPEIDTCDLRLRDQSEKALEAMTSANGKQPRFFQRGGVLVRLRHIDGSLEIQPLGVDPLTGELERIANWWGPTRDGRKKISPPQWVVRDILSLAEWPLPLLNAVAHVPFFSSDNRLVRHPGYNADTGVFLELDENLSVPEVSTVPTLQEVERAKALIFDELLVDFPFVNDSHRAHALGAIISPFVVPIVDAPMPLHLLEAPEVGTGKSLLADIIAIVATGKSPQTLPETLENDELRKQITSTLLNSPPIVLIDNVRRKIQGSSLAALLTADNWSDRLLGVSKIVSLKNRSLFLVTGNNPTTSREIARRTVHIRLNAETDQPWTRHGFKHPNLPLWTREHRGELVWALLTLVQNWIAKGRPRYSKHTLGSFESWAEMVGGILMSAGVSGFLEGRDKLLQEVDEENRGWSDFVLAWREKYGCEKMPSGHLLELALDFIPEVLGDFPGSQGSQLGKALRAHRGRIIAGWKIVETTIKGDKGRNRNGWVLERPITPGDVGTMGEESKTSENSEHFDEAGHPNRSSK